MIPAPSCLGKLPLHGDFLRIRVNQAQKNKLDHWFATFGKTGNVNQLSEANKELTTASSTIKPWCFVMRGGLLGVSNQLLGIGVLFYSFDKIGRRYPFVMYQLVPKRWLINQLKEPNHWLQCLQRFAKGCQYKESGEIDTMLNQLWSIYKPQWLDYVKTPNHSQRKLMTRNAERLLQDWPIPNSKTDDVGVSIPPWINWPRNLNMQNQNSVWWQLDNAGRYIDCTERDTLDRTLLVQLLGRH